MSKNQNLWLILPLLLFSVVLSKPEPVEPDRRPTWEPIFSEEGEFSRRLVNEVTADTPEALTIVYRSMRENQPTHFLIRRSGRVQCLKVRVLQK